MYPVQPILFISVFLCDFRVFRVMIRSSKRIPYTKPKYIQKSRIKKKRMNPVNYRLTPDHTRSPPPKLDSHQHRVSPIKIT